MNAGALRKLLEGVPDSVPVVVSGPDHSYARTGRGTGVRQAAVDGRHLGVVYNEEEQGPTVPVFWIDDGNY
jgi:hypothetical protein